MATVDIQATVNADGTVTFVVPFEYYRDLAYDLDLLNRRRTYTRTYMAQKRTAEGGKAGRRQKPVFNLALPNRASAAVAPPVPAPPKTQEARGYAKSSVRLVLPKPPGSPTVPNGNDDGTRISPRLTVSQTAVSVQ